MRAASACQTNRRRHRGRGFSLVEAAIATGIAALALTTLLGLVPQGLAHLREAGQVSAHARICQQLFGALTQEDWRGTTGADLLATRFDKRRFFFNDQAALIEAEEPDEAAIAYVAELSVPDLDVALPNAMSTDPHLRRVVVRIVSAPLPDFDFEAAEAGTFYIYATVLADTGS